MGLFNDDVISLPEINADIIADVSTFQANNHRTHKELMDIINNFVHGIYYNAKIGIYPENGQWVIEGRIFGIPQAYATGWNMKAPPPPSFKKMYDETRDNLNYIESVFKKLGFESEYVAVDKGAGFTNVIIVRIPFKTQWTQRWETFAQRVHAKTIGADITPVQAMDAPTAKVFFMDSIRTAQQAKQCNGYYYTEM